MFLREVKLHLSIDSSLNRCMWAYFKGSEERRPNKVKWRVSECVWCDQAVFVQTTGISSPVSRESFVVVLVCLRLCILMCTWSTPQERKEGNGNILYKQEFYSIRVSLHFVRENVLCIDMARPITDTLFVFFYYISHFQKESTKIYLLEGDADRWVS